MTLRVCLATALLVAPSVAVAQGNPGPFGGLFGRTPERVGREYTVIEVRSAAGGLYDTALLPSEEDEVGSDTQSGAGAGATVVLGLENVTDRLTASVGGSVAYNQNFAKPNSYRSTSFQGGGRVSGQILTRLTAGASVNYAHSPYFQFLPGVGNPALTDAILPPLSVNTAAVFAENESYNGSAEVAAQLTQRTSFDVTGFHSETRFRRQPESNFSVNGAGASLSRTLSRGLIAHAGYQRQQSRLPGGAPGDFVIESIDVGVDFSRRLSITRKTALGFSSSTAIAKNNSGDRRFRVNGALNLERLFRRTWSASAFFSRGTEFRPGFREPLFTDSVGVSFGGMFNRRIEWTTTAATGRAEYAFSESAGFTNVVASSTLTIGVSRHIGIYGQYGTYFYEAPTGLSTLNLRGRLARQSISVGLSAFIPVYNKVRATP